MLLSITSRHIRPDEEVYRLENANNWIYATQGTLLVKQPSRKNRAASSAETRYIANIPIVLIRIILDYANSRDFVAIEHIRPKHKLLQVRVHHSLIGCRVVSRTGRSNYSSILTV